MRRRRCYWITGIPASGKTTLARAWVLALQKNEVNAVLLDGDELRQGLCSDLGLSDGDRRENIRRAGEVARLMAHAGLTPVCAFVSPFRSDRQRVRDLFAPGEFQEIHLSTPLTECVRRDPKQLYARVKAGQVIGLTGWDAPYEAPTDAEFVFDSLTTSTQHMVRQLLDAR